MSSRPTKQKKRFVSIEYNAKKKCTTSQVENVSTTESLL